MDPTHIGALLRRFRLAAALSQEALAERSTVSVRTISDLERGVRDTARLETLRLLAAGLALSSENRSALIDASIRATVASMPPSQPGRPIAPLPQPTNNLIGREALVNSALEALLEKNSRLVTLIGPGGVGKTRVAIEVASRWARLSKSPVVFVSLAQLIDADRVPSAIAQTFELPVAAESPGESVLQFLAREQRILVVLDNLEHLLEATEFVAQMLTASPGVTMLVTSRSRLRLSMEHEIAVTPLDVPDVGSSYESVMASGAFELFRERAWAIDAELLFEGKAVGIASDICRRVDGLPLAIELAATKLRVMSLDTLRSLLDSRLPVLTGGDRDQPQRQHSMRETIEWSYRLLGEREQQLFRLLSVYVGGISPESVVGSGAALGLSEIDSFETFETLLESGLVQRLTGTGQSPGFRMLETIREYGIEELDRLGWYDEAKSLHAQTILRFCEVGANLPFEGMSKEWLARMQRENANFDAALDFVCGSGQPKRCAEFVSLAGDYWESSGSYREHATRLLQAVRTFPPEPEIVYLHARMRASSLLMYAGETAIATEITKGVLAGARAIGDRRTEAAALHQLGWIAEIVEQWSDMSQYFEQALPLWDELGEEITQAQIFMMLGGYAYVRGDYAEARRLEEAAALIFAEDGSPGWIGATAWYLGFVDIAEHLWHDGAVRFTHSLECWLRFPMRSHWFKPIIHLADVSAEFRDYPTAATLVGCCDFLLESTGLTLFPFDVPAWERATERSRTALGNEQFETLHQAARDLGPADWLRLATTVVDKTESNQLLR